MPWVHRNLADRELDLGEPVTLFFSVSAGFLNFWAGAEVGCIMNYGASRSPRLPVEVWMASSMERELRISFDKKRKAEVVSSCTGCDLSF